MVEAKYKLGQIVRVRHHHGAEWTGQITYRSNPDGESWEYEVSNAPTDRVKVWGNTPGNRWHPLVWESEIVEAIPPTVFCKVCGARMQEN
jgi:hypothetical protein